VLPLDFNTTEFGVQKKKIYLLVTPFFFVYTGILSYSQGDVMTVNMFINADKYIIFCLHNFHLQC
jgi:predicted chitinase